MFYFCQSLCLSCLAKGWSAAKSSANLSSVIWCDKWSMGRRPGSMSDPGSMSGLPLIKFMTMGKSQHPLNLVVKSSSWTLFPMKSYRDFCPIINTNEGCFGSLAGIWILCTWPHYFHFTRPQDVVWKLPRSPQRPLPSQSAFGHIGCDWHSRTWSANDFSNFKVYHCAYTMAVSHDFCSY